MFGRIWSEAKCECVKPCLLKFNYYNNKNAPKETKKNPTETQLKPDTKGNQNQDKD